MKLKNKVAIVTGSKRGIGKGIALCLAKEGCKVVVSDYVEDADGKKTTEELKKISDAIFVKADVSKEND
ncbi:SDR family NAD(P)-dependent oxidoreductase, partial [Candidatus Woesearchaeota archaeon]|nr:SDR family NAD(P)-dependent oxidoreductase [Candidatus Woesearchaeota archaeon]